MTAKITTFLTAAALSLTLAAPAAVAQVMDMGEQITMLEQTVTNALVREGIDTSNVGDLSLNELANIRQLLGEEMSTNEKRQIEQILER